MGKEKRVYCMLLLGTGVDVEVNRTKDALRPVRVFVRGYFGVRMTGKQARDLAERLEAACNTLKSQGKPIPMSPFEA